MKKISLFLIGLLVISFAFCVESNAAAKTYVMRIGYATKGNPLDMAAINFMEKMKKRVGDQVKVELYPAGQLGSNETMLQQLQQGTIQGVMNPPGFLGGRYDLVTILDLPYFLKTDLLSAVRILKKGIGKLVPGNGNKVLRRVEIKKNKLVTGGAGWCLRGYFKVLEFCRGPVGKDPIDKLNRMKNRDLIIIVHIPTDGDTAPWTSCDNH